MFRTVWYVCFAVQINRSENVKFSLSSVEFLWNNFLMIYDFSLENERTLELNFAILCAFCIL